MQSAERQTTPVAEPKPPQAPPETPAAPEPGRLRWPAVLLGCLLIVVDNYWVVRMERVVAGPYPTTISLFANAIFVLAALIGLNALLRRFRPRWQLSQAELLLIYTMVSIGAALAGLDFLPILVQMIGHPFWFVNQGHLAQFGDHLPRQLMVDDVDVLRGYYNGNDTLYRWEYLLGWARPMLIWTVFVVVLIFVMMCINVLVRKQWADRERLSFPIVVLPLEMTAAGGRLFHNKLMWGGLLLAGGIDFINGMAFLYPNIPEITVKHVDLRPMLTTKPWNAMGWTPYSFYPFAVGLGYLLPLDLLFSCWFFYLFWKLQLVVASAAGWDATPDFPFVKEQAFGGYMAILLFLAWIGRGTIREMWRHILGMRSEVDDSSEGMSYRWALIGVIAGVAALSGFFSWIGLPYWIAVVAFGLYFGLSIAITRIRAELGPPVHDMHFSGPDSILTRAWGTTYFDDRQLTAINWFWFFNRAYRGHPMPVGLEGLRMADRTRASRRFFFWAIMLAALVGTVSTFWAYLDQAYALGTTGKFRAGYQMAQQAYNRLGGWITGPQVANEQANWALAIGFLCASGLMLLRLNFWWSPFHPIGFAISGSWSMNLVWLPLFIAWGIKLGVLRYGGLRLFRLLMPFFLGLILGEALVGCGWSLYGLIFNVPTYSFWGA